VIIVASWFVSPVLSGFVSGSFFLAIRTFVLNYGQPFKAACIALPLIYGFTIFLNVFTVLNDGSPRELKKFYYISSPIVT
jgi:solute carrier family 20 (sodium-dependent phosphate transporter)